jgi:hypothetical protein
VTELSHQSCDDDPVFGEVAAAQDHLQRAMELAREAGDESLARSFGITIAAFADIREALGR